MTYTLVRIILIVVGLFFSIPAWVDANDLRGAQSLRDFKRLRGDLAIALVFTAIAAAGVVGWPR